MSSDPDSDDSQGIAMSAAGGSIADAIDLGGSDSDSPPTRSAAGSMIIELPSSDSEESNPDDDADDGASIIASRHLRPSEPSILRIFFIRPRRTSFRAWFQEWFNRAWFRFQERFKIKRKSPKLCLVA
ncbi:hypothetical protein N0V85_008927 [Neurospora sp. IMI 360204]|nr:hypothetical protein N0V85_008927 [Neurospora sp. IMI 360204]